MSATTLYVDLKSGRHTFLDREGDSGTLLLLHGFSFRPGMYPLLNALPNDVRILIPDLPFTTRSQFHQPHTLTNYVDFLLEFVHALGLKKVSIFGNSIGGSLGLLCCSSAPERFESLIVRCPLWTRKQLPLYLRIHPLVSMHQFLSGSVGYAQFLLNVFYRLSARMSPVNRDKIAVKPNSTLPYHADQIDPVVMSKFLGHLLQTDFEAHLPEMTTPTLILWGELDTLIHPKWGLYLQHLLPNARFQEIENEYHNIATARQDTLAEAITSMI